MVGHVMNFFRGVRKVKELIGQGVIGDILYCHGARNVWEGIGASQTWKKTRSKSGGHLYHHIVSGPLVCACTRSLNENRKVRLSKIIKR